MSAIEAEVAALEVMTSKALRRRWVELAGAPVPQISPSMLRLVLAFELQTRAYGGYPRPLTTALDQLGRGLTKTTPARRGMRLVREWNGKAHVVTVGDDNVIRWEGRDYRSLSEVARAITGTRWSGPAFFGLKKRRAA